jgi:hypothetical protein
MKLEKPKETLSVLRQINLIVIGRRTGKTRSFPIWFTLEGNTIHILPAFGTKTQWLKDVEVDNRVVIAFGDHQIRGVAELHWSREKVADVKRRLERKYGERVIARAGYTGLDATVTVTLSG